MQLVYRHTKDSNINSLVNDENIKVIMMNSTRVIAPVVCDLEISGRDRDFTVKPTIFICFPRYFEHHKYSSVRLSIDLLDM